MRTASVITICLCLLVLLSCSYEPWHYKKYGPIDGKPNYHFKDNDGVSGLKVYIASSYKNPSYSGPPFQLRIVYYDHKMIWDILRIKGLVVSTSKERLLFAQELTTLKFFEPSLVGNIQPYFKSAELRSKDLDIDHSSPERIRVRFEFSLYNSSLINELQHVEVEFEPYTDKGIYKPAI